MHTFGISMEDVIEEILKFQKKSQVKNRIGLFELKTANEWLEEAQKQPIPKMLFSEFWFEGELCILFADTNLGKSILAVQIADSITTGRKIQGFKLETSKQETLYFDFELSKKQFENRYSDNYQNHYDFDNNFIRIEISPDALIPDEKSLEEYICDSLEKTIIERNTKILIIDNITFLRSENEKAKDALPLMKHIKALKTKYSLSILVLAHTPKRDLSKPITRNDLQGSKMLMNFCDSAFAIGESYNDRGIRYIKQIKQRNTESIYDSENVCICQINKPTNFLQFEFQKYGLERDHLKELTKKAGDELIEKVIQLKNQGLTLREIGEKLGISHTKADRILKKANSM